MRCACVVDLALRLLLLWTSAEAHDAAASWVQELVKAAGQASPAALTEEGKYMPQFMQHLLPPCAKQGKLYHSLPLQ